MRISWFEPDAGMSRFAQLASLVLALAAPVLFAQAPDDPRFPEQWHLSNTGQGGGAPGADLHIGNIWTTYRGSQDQIICIIGDGISIGHEDLTANTVNGLHFDFTADPTTDPTTTDPVPHPRGTIATQMAGIAAGVGYNGIGIVGVAPSAGLISYAVATDATDDDLAKAFLRNRDLWSIGLYPIPSDDIGTDATTPSVMGLSLIRAIKQGVELGRHNLGNFLITDAGDNGSTTESLTTYSGMSNSPYMNVIGGFDFLGQVTVITRRWGPNILVSAPYKGTGLAIVTTDTNGETTPTDTGGTTEVVRDNAYTTEMDSVTSASAAVAGVVALMLQANPKLNWLDIRQILLATARKTTDSTFVGNGGDLTYSSVLGYGLVDTEKAVRTAAEFITSGQRLYKTVEDLSMSSPIAIPNAIDLNTNNTVDDNEAVPLNISLDYSLTATGSPRNNFFVEYVTVTVNIPEAEVLKPVWGDLQMNIISPTGAVFGITELHSSGAGALENYTFGVQSFFGSSLIDRTTGSGVWTLQIIDRTANGSLTDPTVDYKEVHFVKFTFYGRDDVDGDGLPDDWEKRFFGNIGVTNSRTADNDGDGLDNFAEFLRGTDPGATALAIYNLNVNERRVDASGEHKLQKRGLLFTNLESGLSRAVLTWTENGVKQFAEEDWTGGNLRFSSFKVNGSNKVEDLIASFSPAGLPYTNRFLSGNRLTKSFDLGVSVKRQISKQLAGFLATSDAVARSYSFGPINTRINQSRSAKANNQVKTLAQAINDYKAEIKFVASP